MSRHKGKLLDKLPRIAGFLIDEHGKSRPVRFGPIRHRSLTLINSNASPVSGTS